MPTPTIKQRYCSVESASHYCSVSRTTIYKLIRDGEIRSATIGARRVIDLWSIDHYIERRLDTPLEPALDPESLPCPASMTSCSGSGSSSTSG